MPAGLYFPVGTAREYLDKFRGKRNEELEKIATRWEKASFIKRVMLCRELSHIDAKAIAARHLLESREKWQFPLVLNPNPSCAEHEVYFSIPEANYCGQCGKGLRKNDDREKFYDLSFEPDMFLVHNAEKALRNWMRKSK